MKALRNKKVIITIIILFVALILSYVIPTLARYKSRNLFDKGSVWSGETATRYRSGSGSQNDPYIISNAEEMAYLASELNNTNYEDTYFKLSNNIIINAGEFSYQDNNIQYTLNSGTYYLNNTDYYSNNTFEGEKAGSINLFPSLSNFKGHLNGNNKIIYGYYGNSSLFDNLSGDIANLYIENAFVNTTGSNAIFANNILNANVSNILIDGYVISPTSVNSITSNDLVANNNNHTYIATLANNISNSTISNIINHANINGGDLGSGIANIVDSSTINNAYNTGIINSFLNTTVGMIEGVNTLSNLYTSGLNDSLIGVLNSATLTISNSFMINNHPFIIDNVNSTITSNNNYFVYQDNSINGTLVSINDLVDHNYLTTYLEHSNENPNNMWLFDNYNLPVLYFDDIVTKNVTLHLASNSWNSYSPIVDNLLFNNNIVFAIDDVDNLNPVSKYYYISNSSEVINYHDLANVNWEPYTDVVTINTEGTHIIYVKTVDNNLNEHYINSEVLILDQTNPTIDVIFNNNHYNSVSNDNVRIANSFSVTASASDTMTGIKELGYYISNTALNDLTNVTWLNYDNQIDITTLGNYQIYFKAVDNSGNISYSSTPLINYNGYVVSNIKPLGLNSGTTINNLSSISFDIDYNNGNLENIEHYLTSNINIPNGTSITLKTNNKVYKTIINNSGVSCLNNLYCYPLRSFKELGRSDNTNYVNSNVADESFNIVMDFSNADILNSITDIKINMAGKNGNDFIRLPIDQTGFNINVNNDGRLSHTITTTYDGTIIINSNNSYQIPVSSIIDLKNNQDTSYYDKKIGIAISFIDTNNQLRSDLFKNIIVMVDNQEYHANSDNIIRINLNRNSSINKTINIITNDGNNLTSSTGYLKITGYASYDGLFNSLNNSNDILIPYVVNDNTYYEDYSFDVSLDSDSQIINKGDTASLAFGIAVSDIANPNIRVSMYQKTNNTAYNQDYSIIDMQTYTSTTLNRARVNYYYVNQSININNIFTYELNTTNLNRSLYRFNFDLYDGDKKVTTINKYIIVR